MVRRSTFTNRAQLSVTQLEARDVPAGNVLAVMTGSTLVITGDEFDNGVSVEGHLDDTVAVRVGTQTSINGSNETLFFTGVRRIEFVGREGDDFVGFSGSMTSDVLINTGNGNDIVSGSLYLDGDLEVTTGDGHDQVYLDTPYHTGSILLNTGNGVDAVSVSLGMIEGDLSINTGNGNDAIAIYPSYSGPYYGGYLLGNLNIDGGNGQGDTLHINSGPLYFFGDLNISGIEIRD